MYLLCFIAFSALLTAASCQGQFKTFICNPGQEFVDVELGNSERRARLVASISGQNHKPLNCSFRVFSKHNNDVIYFRLGNVTLSGRTCDDASVRLFDIDGNTYQKTGELEQYCATAHGNGMKAVSSSVNAMIIEVWSRSQFSLQFNARVYDLPTPCPFFCAEEERCLVEGQRCDRSFDCKDGSDENGCDYAGDDRSSSLVGSFDDRSVSESPLIGAITMPEVVEKVNDEIDDRATPYIEGRPFVPPSEEKEKEEELGDRISYMSSGLNSGCGSPRIQQGMTGSFASLNYPCPYGPRLLCNWEISVPSGKVITIGFNTIFYIEPVLPLPGIVNATTLPVTIGNATTPAPKPTCSDVLNIYALRGETGTEEVLVRSFCGYKAPKPFYVRSNRLRIEFKSDDQIDGYGFRLHWAAANPETLEQLKSGFSRSGGPGGRPPVTLKSEACAPNSRGELLTRRSGSLGSPRFKNGNYTYGSNCTWIITGAADQVIVLFFSEFALEPSTDCSFDAVNIWDGNNLVAKYCGHDFIPPMQSRTNKVMVTFTSDQKVEDAGFRIFYHIVDLNQLSDSRVNRVKAPVLSALQVPTVSSGPISGTLQPSRPAPAMPPMMPVSVSETSGTSTTKPVQAVDYHVDETPKPNSLSAGVRSSFSRSGKKLKTGVTRVSLSKCGNIPGSAWAATFNGNCYGSLIHKRWLLATTNCLAKPLNNNSINEELNFANVIDWASNKTVGNVHQVWVKDFKFQTQPKPTRFTGMAIVQLAKPVDEILKTPGRVCLPSDGEDDDLPDGSCEFPSSPGFTKRQHHLHTKSKLSNSKCADVLLAARTTIPADRLHMFECFLVQDVDAGDEDTLLSQVDKLPIMKNYCEVSDLAHYRAMFAELPLKFCKNYEEAWTISGILVQVLTSNPVSCGELVEGGSVGTAETTGVPSTNGRYQVIAVYVRVSHFFEWIFTVTGNGGTSDDPNKLIKAEDEFS